MNRIDRLFSILTFIQSKKYVPAEKIAEKFNISLRTVYRDIKALGESGIPISFEQYKGYFVMQGYFLPPVSFTSEEANAFLLMQAIVSGFADQSIKKHYSTGLNKIKSVLRSNQKEKIEHLTNNIRLQVPACFNYNFEYLSALQTAIASKTIIEISYSNAKSEISLRHAEPIGLVFYAFGWHLIGWCHLRKEYRDFKVPRILKLTNTNLPFTQISHISLDTYMQKLPVDY